MYFSARTEGISTFQHTLRAAYRTAISAAQILVLSLYSCCDVSTVILNEYMGMELDRSSYRPTSADSRRIHDG